MTKPFTDEEILRFKEIWRKAGISEEEIEILLKNLSLPVEQLKTTSLIYAYIVGMDALMAGSGKSVDSNGLKIVAEELDRRIPIPIEFAFKNN